MPAALLLLWRVPNWQPGFVRWLAWIGAISYSLYLLHQNLGVTVIQALPRAGLPDVAAMVIASAAMVGLAYLGFRFVEKPGARWVMRMYGARGAAEAQAPTSEPAQS